SATSRAGGAPPNMAPEERRALVCAVFFSVVLLPGGQVRYHLLKQTKTLLGRGTRTNPSPPTTFSNRRTTRLFAPLIAPLCLRTGYSPGRGTAGTRTPLQPPFSDGESRLPRPDPLPPPVAARASPDSCSLWFAQRRSQWTVAQASAPSTWPR